MQKIIDEIDRNVFGDKLATKGNFGCGRRVYKGWINVDSVQFEGVDVVHDLNKIPYPFRDETFDFIVMNSILEHLDDPDRTLKEIYRILKKSALLYIHVPSYRSPQAYLPVHKSYFSTEYFRHFERGSKKRYMYEYNFLVIMKMSYYRPRLCKIIKKVTGIDIVIPSKKREERIDWLLMKQPRLKQNI